MSFKVTSLPSTQPIALSDLKAHCRVETDFTLDDTYIGELALAAWDLLESLCGTTYLERTIEERLRCFPVKGVHRLQFTPIVEVTSIEVNGNAFVDFEFDEEEGYIAPTYGNTWPTVEPGLKPIVITYTAGTAEALIPEAAKQAVKTLVATWYRDREEVAFGGMPVPFGFKTIAAALEPGRYGE